MRSRNLVVLVAFSSLLVGCGVASSNTASSGKTLGVTLDEYHVKLDASTIPAGTVTFDVKNTGSEKHEFVILKTDVEAAALPSDPATNKVQEETSGVQHVDEIDGVGPGGQRALTVSLTQGTYLIVCNYPGHVHAGMVTMLTVT
jgi:uncharacterized cupredoxin-like copper-binding protein